MYPTPTFTPGPAPTRAAYLAFEKSVLSPYLSTLANALPQVKHFQIWRLRTRGEDHKTGTRPVKEKELLDLLGGRARDIDCQAGFPVVQRFPDGSAVKKGMEKREWRKGNGEKGMEKREWRKGNGEKGMEKREGTNTS